MKPTILFCSVLLLCIFGCTTTDDSKDVELVEQTPEVDYLRYMQSLPITNNNCLQEDYIYLNIDGEEVEYYYSNPNNGIALCTFNEGNVSGVMCSDCEGHYSSLPFPLEYAPYFPDFPITVGGEFPQSNKTKIISEILPQGLNIRFSIPMPVIDNIVAGKYRLSESFVDPGVNVQLGWSVAYEGGFSGYTLELTPDRPYTFELECVDTSNPDFLRLTGNFQGTFVSEEQFDSTPFQYEIPIQGRFSYKLTRI